MMAAIDLRKLLGLDMVLGERDRVDEVITTRVAVSETDSFVVPAHIQSLRIYRGQAWVSSGLKDFFMYRGQELRLTQGKTTVLTSIGRKPVTVDLYSLKR